MQFEEFKTEAIKTESRIEAVEFQMDALVSVLSMAMEVGNLMDMIKKNVFYGKPIDENTFKESLHTIKLNSVYVQDNKTTQLSSPKQKVNINPRIFHAIVGKFTESVELLGALANPMLNGEELDKVNVAEEIGDDQWYTAILLDELNIPMSTIHHTVINKLKARYPDKFTSDAAINRDLTSERKILEEGVSEHIHNDHGLENL